MSFFQGGTVENFEFQMDDDTGVSNSCSATLNGELFVFGGSAYNKQVDLFLNILETFINELNKVSKVIGCGLKRIGDLSNEFWYGTCATYLFPQERILLCFPNSEQRACMR